ncbi:MAG: FAD-dependent monooxygenase [Vicinamibacterales bacterium]
MDVTIVGGGPAGLCVGLLLKQQNPAHHVTIIDRRREGDTYGWGITLPRRTAALLEASDAPLAAGLLERSVSWHEIRVCHRGLAVQVAGMPLLGISRAAMLELFVQRCRDAGVELRFGVHVAPPFEPACDLLVVAEGARGALRAQHEADFGTVVRASVAHYAWLGTSRRFASLSLAFEETPEGIFTAHAYPFSDTASTFIVECTEDTLRKTGLAESTSEETCAFLSRVFVEPLQGESLRFRQPLTWRRFMRVSNARWQRQRTVLVGDAAHALHFSIGSGTLLAIEDALALAACLREASCIETALKQFEAVRRPALKDYYDLEERMLNKFNGAADLLRLDPLELAYALLA